MALKKTPALYFLVNPNAGSGRGKQIWKTISEYLQQNQTEYQCVFLKETGEASRIVHSLTSGSEKSVIAVVGGDGTINECISGIVDFSQHIFAFIPAGSANDLALALDLPSDPLDTVRMILSPEKILHLNIGLLEQEKIRNDEKEDSSPAKSRFIVSSGIGYDAAICYEASRSGLKSLSNRLHLGKFSYTLTAIRMLAAMKPMQVSVLADDSNLYSYNRVYFVSAMNAFCEGGGYRFCPEADPSDDQLDLMIAEGLSKPMALIAMPLARFGWHVKLKGVHILRCSKADIQVGPQDPPACLHTDGEHAGFSGKITWTLAEEKLKVIVKGGS